MNVSAEPDFQQVLSLQLLLTEAFPLQLKVQCPGNEVIKIPLHPCAQGTCGAGSGSSCALTYLDCEQSHRYPGLATGTDSPPITASLTTWTFLSSWCFSGWHTTNTSLNKLMLKIMGECKCHCSNTSGTLCAGDTIYIYSALCGKLRICFPEQVQENLSCNCSCRHGEIPWRVMALAQENSKWAANTSEQMLIHLLVCAELLATAPPWLTGP